MAAKITITGMPVGNIVQTADYFRFEMEEGGSPTSPKGLPAASVMTFSVFVATKAGKKLGLPRPPAQRLLVQGELVADLPISECPGEMGVIAFKIEEILPKKDPVPDSEWHAPAPPIGQEESLIAPASLTRDQPSRRQSSAEPWPDLSAYPVVPLEQIIIPEEFQHTMPSVQRTAEVQARVEKWGQLDEPVGVQRIENPPGYLLTDGYRRYLIARQLGWATVPVRIESAAAGDGNPPA